MSAAGLRQTGDEPSLQFRPIEVSPDEDHLGIGAVFSPGVIGPQVQQPVNRLQNVEARIVFDGDNALQPEDIVASRVEQSGEMPPKLIFIESLLEYEGFGGHGGIMDMMVVMMMIVSVEIEQLRALGNIGGCEPADAQNAFQLYLRVAGP